MILLHRLLHFSALQSLINLDGQCSEVNYITGMPDSIQYAVSYVILFTSFHALALARRVSLHFLGFD